MKYDKDTIIDNNKGGRVKTKRQVHKSYKLKQARRAVSPISSIAQGIALGKTNSNTMRPVRAKVLNINTFALTIIFAPRKKRERNSFN